MHSGRFLQTSTRTPDRFKYAIAVFEHPKAGFLPTFISIPATCPSRTRKNRVPAGCSRPAVGSGVDKWHLPLVQPLDKVFMDLISSSGNLDGIASRRLASFRAQSLISSHREGHHILLNSPFTNPYYSLVDAEIGILIILNFILTHLV